MTTFYWAEVVDSKVDKNDINVLVRADGISFDVWAYVHRDVLRPEDLDWSRFQGSGDGATRSAAARAANRWAVAAENRAWVQEQIDRIRATIPPEEPEKRLAKAQVSRTFGRFERVEKWLRWLDSPKAAAAISVIWLGGGEVASFVVSHSMVWWTAVVVQAVAALPFLGLMVRGAFARSASKSLQKMMMK